MTLSSTKTNLLIIMMAVVLALGLLPGNNVQAAAIDGLTAQEKNSSYGFFLWLSENAPTDADKEDAKIAAQILKNNIESKYNSSVFNNGNISASTPSNVTYDMLLAQTSIGAENDATSLDALKESINFVSLGNEYRAGESLAPLKISSGLMAMAELDANYQPTNWGHPLVFNALENLAYYGTSARVINYDPYQGWYVNEKENFDSNNGGQTGHYKTLTDRKGVMKQTGFATKFYPNTSMNEKYYSQFFSNTNFYNVGNGFTPEEYLGYLMQYQCSVVGHQMEKTEGVAHTCTEDGTITYYTCKNCGKKFSDEAGKNEVTDIKDPAPGHSWNEEYTIDVEASCTKEGSKSIHCSVCKAVKPGSTTVIGKTDHKWDEGQITKPITLTNLEGEKLYTCQACTQTRTEHFTVNADHVEGWINALPVPVTLDDETTVTRIREIYNGLDSTEKAKVNSDILKKLDDAEQTIQAEKKLKEDRIAASQVAAMIADMNPDNKESVYAVKQAYDGLSDDQRSLLDLADVNKLTDAVSAIEEKERIDQEAAAQVTNLIETMDPTDRSSVEEAKAAFDALSAEQKNLISDSNKTALSDAYNAFITEDEKNRLNQEAANQVVDMIEDMDPNDRSSVEAAKAAYEALFDDQKILISPDIYNKLTEALDNLDAIEEKISQDKAAAARVTALIENMSLEERTSIDEAKAAYDALEDDQRKYISSENQQKLSNLVEQLQAIRDAEEKKRNDQEAADNVTSLIQNMEISNKDSVTAAKAAYDKLTDTQKKLLSNETVKQLENALKALEPKVGYEDPSSTKAPTKVKVKQDQTFTVKASKKTVKAKKLKKKAQKVSPITVKSAVGTISYKITGGKKKAKKALKIDAQTGKITIKKGTKKGTYKVKVTVSAAGNEDYKAGSRTVDVSVKVK